MSSITFSKFAVGTVNPVFTFDDNTVYAFGGIRTDSANPTSPVLAGSASSFFPPVSVRFEYPVETVTLDAGYFNNFQSTQLILYAADGSVVANVLNQEADGIESFAFTDSSGTGIVSLSVVAIATEDAGFAIDNLTYDGVRRLDFPELEDGELAERYEYVLGDIENRAGTILDGEFQVGDPRDQISFMAETPVKVTWVLRMDGRPDTIEEIEVDYPAGLNIVQLTPPEGGYDGPEGYTLAISSVVPQRSERSSAIDQATTDLAQTLLKLGTVDTDQLIVGIKAGVATTDDAKEFLEALGKKLGKAAILIDVLFRVDNVLTAEDPARELFIQTVDFAGSFLAGVGGAAAGGSFGSLFAGIGAGIGAPVGGFVSGIVYSFGVSSSVQEAAGEFWDSFDEDAAPQNAPLEQAAPLLVAALAEAAAEPVEAQIFDEAFYLATYPDAAAAVSGGTYASAYMHFLAEGAELGYLPAADAVAVDPADLPGAGDDRLDRVDTAFGYAADAPLAGDGLSPEEETLYDMLVEARTEGFQFTLNDALTRLANRKAYDLVHNGQRDPEAAQALGGSDWDQLWSTGETFEDPDFVRALSLFGLKVGAVAAAGVTAEEALQAFFAETGFRAELLSNANISVGVAEYGGVWVIVLSDSFTFQNTPVVAANDDPMTRSGSEADDQIALGTWQGALAGFGGNDKLTGGDRADDLDGGEGDDALFGNAGEDTLFGDRGDDSMAGGAGADDMRGGLGDDEMHGDDGDDVLRGSRGEDTISGGLGDDEIAGQRNADTIDGGAGADTLRGGGGNDALSGGDGDDFINGGTRRDVVLGGAGDDNLIGRSFADELRGGDGRDKLNGGGEADTLEGGAGKDRIKGGEGADVFEFRAGFELDLLVQVDLQEDVLMISSELAAGRSAAEIAALATRSGAHTEIDFGDGDVIRFLRTTDMTGLEDAIDFL